MIKKYWKNRVVIDIISKWVLLWFNAIYGMPLSIILLTFIIKLTNMAFVHRGERKTDLAKPKYAVGPGTYEHEIHV